MGFTRGGQGRGEGSRYDAGLDGGEDAGEGRRKDATSSLCRKVCFETNQREGVEGGSGQQTNEHDNSPRKKRTKEHLVPERQKGGCAKEERSEVVGPLPADKGLERSIGNSDVGQRDEVKDFWSRGG